MMMNHSQTSGPLKGELSELLNRSGANTALLITKEGSAITEAGDCSYLNTTALAALIAAMFTATKEVAGMVGEKQFSILLQQGERRHIHISLVSEGVMMVVIFESGQSVGRVRYESQRTGRSLCLLIDELAGTRLGQEALSVPQFKEYALNLIERIFIEK
jgi:predicted regulator of Ras-like GTPase activity (Roadblock/LC7/MglB family)